MLSNESTKTCFRAFSHPSLHHNGKGSIVQSCIRTQKHIYWGYYIHEWVAHRSFWIWCVRISFSSHDSFSSAIRRSASYRKTQKRRVESLFFPKNGKHVHISNNKCMYTCTMSVHSWKSNERFVIQSSKVVSTSEYEAATSQWRIGTDMHTAAVACSSPLVSQKPWSVPQELSDPLPQAHRSETRLKEERVEGDGGSNRQSFPCSVEDKNAELQIAASTYFCSCMLAYHHYYCARQARLISLFLPLHEILSNVNTS